MNQTEEESRELLTQHNRQVISQFSFFNQLLPIGQWRYEYEDSSNSNNNITIMI